MHSKFRMGSSTPCKCVAHDTYGVGSKDAQIYIGKYRPPLDNIDVPCEELARIG